MICRFFGVIFAVLTLLASSVAYADELGDFQEARAAYEARNFGQSVSLFEALVSGPTPRVTSRALVIESRKYLAASYLFVTRRSDAEREFELLLRSDPSYELDAFAFPREVGELFRVVKDRVSADLREQEIRRQRDEEARRQAEIAAIARDRERHTLLMRLAAEERVETHRSRWIALIPFGAGQFQNGDSAFGITLASTEGALILTSVVSWALHAGLPTQTTFETYSTADQSRVRSTELALTIVNYASLGLFAAFAIAGIIDAEARFTPVSTEIRQRELPPQLRENTIAFDWSLTGLAIRWM